MSRHDISHASRSQVGFTLIEVVGAFFMMVVILVFITGIFVENGRQRSAATELMRERLSATGTLDMIAADLEGAIFLARSEGVAPEDHAWQFIAEGNGDLGADSLRFVSQNAPSSHATAEHASNWVEIAYFLEENEDDELVLWRWRSARPPSNLDRGFPDSNEDGSMRIAVGVDSFGVRLLDSNGEWLDEWDSTYQPPDHALPVAAEISLTLMRAARRGEATDETIVVPGLPHMRRVVIAMDPLNVDALIALSQDDGDQDANCFTVGQCLDVADDGWYGEELDSQCGGDEQLCALLSNPDVACWRAIESNYPEIAALAPAGCG